jgi:hypothetical protein
MYYLSPHGSWYKTNARTLPWRTTANTEKVGTVLVPVQRKSLTGFLQELRICNLHPKNSGFSTKIGFGSAKLGGGGRGIVGFLFYT